MIIIGGAEDKKGDKAILREFVRMAGGAKARVVVMTVATELPEEVGAEYIRVFSELIGPDGSVTTVDVEECAAANAAYVL